MTIEYAHSAIQDLRLLDPAVRQRVLQKLDWFFAQEHPLSFAKPVKNLLPITHRFRIGDLRVLVALIKVGNKLIVVAVRRRDSAYD